MGVIVIVQLNECELENVTGGIPEVIIAVMPVATMAASFMVAGAIAIREKELEDGRRLPKWVRVSIVSSAATIGAVFGYAMYYQFLMQSAKLAITNFYVINTNGDFYE